MSPSIRHNSQLQNDLQRRGTPVTPYRIATAHGAALCRVWAAGTAPPTAHSRAILIETPEVVRGQYYGPAGQLLANPWVLAAILTSAITVVALAANRDSGS